MLVRVLQIIELYTTSDESPKLSSPCTMSERGKCFQIFLIKLIASFFCPSYIIFWCRNLWPFKYSMCRFCNIFWFFFTFNFYVADETLLFRSSLKKKKILKVLLRHLMIINKKIDILKITNIWSFDKMRS